jgi:hypothetical protein
MKPLVLDHGAALPPQKRTIRQQMDAQAAAQALLRVDAEVRALGRDLGANPAAVQELVQRARVTFRPVGARVRPLASDGRTELRSPDGAGVLSVAEWMASQAEASPEPFDPPLGGVAHLDPPSPLRNPFARQHWNLTEQMRLRKTDPERAARLKLAAWNQA